MTSVEIGSDGIWGDRCWCIVDRLSGAVAAPEKEERWRPGLFLHARLHESHTEIGFPDGEWLSVTNADIGKRLSDHFGFDATVLPYAKAGLPDTTSIAVNRYEPSPLHIITTNTMAHLANLTGIGDITSKRFRPTLVLRTETNGEFDEKMWLGRWLQLGTDVISVPTEETKRCGLTLIAQPGIAENADVLRTILRQNRRNLGIYANVERGGAIAIGDSAHFLEV